MSTEPDFSKLRDFPAADWEAEFRQYIGKEIQFLPDDWVSKIEVKGPVLEQLKLDGDELMKLKSQRPDRAASIKCQAESVQGMACGLTALVGARDLAKLDRPMTSKALNAANEELLAVVFYFKSKFNAARPSAYLPNLEPMFAKPDPLYPGHPSYPSGHAAQSRMVALIYGDMFPTLTSRLTELGNDVAHNREVAGVHFESDSKAGQEIAEQVFKLLKANPKFANLLELARVEWPGNKGL
ncbi:MAG: hypothetical protein JF617_14920 [Burkholderiales bacterium]|nr:hypothetical protein [Burkholderiales bacterium]